MWRSTAQRARLKHEVGTKAAPATNYFLQRNWLLSDPLPIVQASARLISAAVRSRSPVLELRSNQREKVRLESACACSTWVSEADLPMFPLRRLDKER